MPDEYRITSDDLLETIENWDGLMDFRVSLIACGGTAMTLLGTKESTKDVDLILPIHKQYGRLLKFLAKIGYCVSEKANGWVHPDDPSFVFQFWRGSQVFTTSLLDSPLEEGRHILINRYRHIYLGALNLLDLIITKMFRGTPTDLEDCVAVFSTGSVDPDELHERYSETASYEVNTKRMMQHFTVFVEELSSRQLVCSDFVERVRSCQ